MEAAAIVPIAVVVLVLGFILLGRRAGNKMTGTSKKDAAQIERLMATGGKARATIAASTPTGLTVNSFNVQVKVDFWLEPLDGSPKFEASKKMYFFESQFPRQGDIWPAWYDHADRSTFAVGAPGKLDPAQIPLYREFDIAHPLDQS